MNNIHVNIYDRDRDTVSFVKSISIPGSERKPDTSFKTPTPAHNGRERTRDVSPHPESYGVNEVHRTFTVDELKKGLDSSNSNFKQDIARAINNTTDGEANIVFPALRVISSKKTTPADVEISKAQFKPMIQFLNDIAHIFSTPLFGYLVDEMRNGEESINAYRTLIQNTKNFLDACEELGVTTPVMGVLSAIPELTEDGEWKVQLLELYGEKDLRAFCVDYHRRTITTPDNLTEFALTLGDWLKEERIQRDSLLYAINMRRVSRATSEIKEPLKFAGFSALYDIVGGYHVPLKRKKEDYPDEGFQRNPWIFEKNDCHCKEYTPAEIQKVSFKTGYNTENLAEKAARYDYRDVEKRLNPEQMVFTAEKLRQAITENRVRHFYREETGISKTTIDRLTEFCSQYDQETLT